VHIGVEAEDGVGERVAVVMVVEEPAVDLFSRRACWMATRSNLVVLVVSVIVVGMCPPLLGEKCAKSSNQKT
jgi:hypothetical protein